MKIFIALVLSFSVLGCSSVQNVGIEKIHQSDIVTLTSKCNEQCKAAVSSRFDISNAKFLFSTDDPVRRYVILSEVDGVRGSGTYFDDAGAFNKTWDGSFNVKTSPGKKRLLLNPTSVSIAPNKSQVVEFEAEPGASYVVANMGWREMRGVQVSFWSPLIYNIEKDEFLYPKEDPSWIKYCTLHQEFSGEAECP